MKLTQPSTPLSQRVEFASPQWCSEAQRFLHDQVKARGGLPGGPVRLGGVYTKAPPHLGCDGNVAGWQIAIDGDSVEVTAGPPDPSSLDHLTRGDYNAAIPVATTVYGSDPTVAARAQRESLHRASAGHPKGTGSLDLARTPELAEVLRALHDHMARRTVNNPDVGHRIKHYGLEPNLADLDEKGYTILERAATGSFADELRVAGEQLHDERSAPGFRVHNMVTHGRIFEEASQHPWVMALMEHLLGRGCTLYTSNCIRKAPGDDTHPGLHSDYLLLAEPFPEVVQEATSVWALEDWVPEIGPTRLVPGSFRERRHPRPGDGADAVLIEMPKGSIAVWVGATWHGAATRSAPGYRLSLHNAYSRLTFRPIDNYYEIDPEIIERNPPAFSTICGLDDFFGKRGDSGPDPEKMMFAHRAGFGTSTPPLGPLNG